MTGGTVIGVDVGGTFTDVYLWDEATGKGFAHKVPSTPSAFVEGFVSGVDEALGLSGSANPVQRIVHGTTVATNALVQQRGARLGFLMTRGMRDILFVGLGRRSRMYDTFFDPVEPLFLAPRRRFLEVDERMGAAGEVVIPLNTASVEDAADTLVNEHGVEAIVVCFLNSYANGSHERQAAEVLAGRYPGLAVTTSSDVLPRAREYRRLVAAGFDAYVKPVMRNYLQSVAEQLEAVTGDAPLLVMKSNGGAAGVAGVIRRPIATLLSGPAAGVVGAARAAVAAGHPDCVTLDMGGTSADVSLVLGGRPATTADGYFDDYPVHITMVDVRAIGAGGSSIARVDDAGGLRVGPRSAGANPGPACYGRGGESATVTDAGVVLGYLDPSSFAGGIALDTELAAAALTRDVAEPLGMDLVTAAHGVHQVAATNMADAVRLVTVRKGRDPRRLALVAFGGAGPVHAGRLAAEVGMTTVIIPPAPGVLSAMGLLVAPVQHEAQASIPPGRASSELATETFADLDRRCSEQMADERLEGGTIQVLHYASVRYEGQAHELEVLMGDVEEEGLLERIEDAFHAEHVRIYGHARPDAPTRLISLRAEHRAYPAIVPTAAATPGDGNPQPRVRPAWFDGVKRDIDIWRRADLPPDFEIDGPAIVEQLDTTVVVYPGDRVVVDGRGNLVMTIAGSDNG